MITYIHVHVCACMHTYMYIHNIYSIIILVVLCPCADGQLLVCSAGV